jgi:hypothetical protein
MPGSRFSNALRRLARRSNWIEAALVPLVAATMRTAWMAPLVAALLGLPLIVPEGVAFPAWLVMALLLGASLLQRLSQRLPQPRAVVIVVGLGVLVGVPTRLLGWPLTSVASWKTVLALTDFSIGIPAALVVVVATALLYRHGLMASWGYLPLLWRDFVAGVVVLGLLMLGGPTVAPGRDELPLWDAMLLFLVSGLAALALLAVLEAVASEGARATPSVLGRGKAALNRHWLAAVSSLMLTVILLGLILAQVLSPQTLAALGRVFGPLAWAVGQVVLLLISALAYVIFWLLGPLLAMLQKRQGEPVKPLNMGRPLGEQLSELERTATTFPATVEAVLRGVLVLLLLGGVIALFALAWRKRHSEGEGGVIEERESVWSKQLLLDQLRALLGHKPPATMGPAFLALDAPEEPRQAIRLLYQQLLSLAQTLGHPRAPGVTPLAHQHRLEQVLPRQRGALATLTALYLRARYAEEARTPAEVDKARQALAAIEAEATPRPQR